MKWWITSLALLCASSGFTQSYKGDIAGKVVDAKMGDGIPFVNVVVVEKPFLGAAFRFYLKNWNINVFVALMNVFNTKNVFFVNHRGDRTKKTVYQFSFFPVAGIEVEW